MIPVLKEKYGAQFFHSCYINTCCRNKCLLLFEEELISEHAVNASKLC